MRVDRATVDLGGYPDLVVVYSGDAGRRPRGMLRLLGSGRNFIARIGSAGGVAFACGVFVVIPRIGGLAVLAGLDSLERWTRSAPHRDGGRSSCGTRGDRVLA